MSYKTLKEYMEATNATERVLAEKLGVSPSYINLIKNGKRRPDPELAAKIESLTGIPFRDLLIRNRKTA